MKTEQRFHVWLFCSLAVVSLVVGIWSFHSLQKFHQRLENLLRAEIVLSQYQSTMYEIQTSSYLATLGDTAQARARYDESLRGISESLANLKGEALLRDPAVITVGEITCQAAGVCEELLTFSEHRGREKNSRINPVAQIRQTALLKELESLGQKLDDEHQTVYGKIRSDILTAHISIQVLLWTACVALLVGIGLLMVATWSMWSIQQKLEHGNAELAGAMKELQKTQLELVQSEKLASVGQLAAGIAHEINTPIQFVGDNVRACADMLEDLRRLVNAYRSGFEVLGVHGDLPRVRKEVEQVEQEVDPDFLFDDIPLAISQTLEGVERVRKIVRAMKDFSHTGSREHAVSFDLNHCIQNTLTIAHNEIKYHAEVELRLQDLPLVNGHPDEINQMLLNLILNASHAIQDRKTQERGLLRISTRMEPDWVVLSVSDNGCGIPQAIRHRIFEPFFTTKEVGRGSGQGLPIVRNIVVESHRGTIDVESEEGLGTMFTVRLPWPGLAAIRSNARGLNESHGLLMEDFVELAAR